MNKVRLYMIVLGLILLMPKNVFSQGRGFDTVEEIKSSQDSFRKLFKSPAGNPVADEEFQPDRGIAQAIEMPEMPEAAVETLQQVSTEAQAEVSQQVVPESSLIEIKKSETQDNLYSIELKDADLADLYRTVAHDYQLNILIDKEVSGNITASLTNISLTEALEIIAEMHNLEIDQKGSVMIIKPHLVTEVFVLNHIDVKIVLGQDGGSSQDGGSQGPGGSSDDSGGGGGDQSALKASTIYDFLSPKGKLFLGAQPNSLMVSDYPSNVNEIKFYLSMVDQGKAMVRKEFKMKYISARELLGIESSDSSSDEESGSSEGSSEPVEGGP